MHTDGATDNTYRRSNWYEDEQGYLRLLGKHDATRGIPVPLLNTVLSQSSLSGCMIKAALCCCHVQHSHLVSFHTQRPVKVDDEC